MNAEGKSEKHDPGESAVKLRPWRDPEIRELEVSRTANNPGVLSDGGVADCNHV